MFQDIQDGPPEREADPAGRKRASQSGEKKAERAKRVRVSRACDQCRAGREKCDGAQPYCQTCETQNRSCTYHEQPKKRGIQPNYIRTLELTLAWLLKTFPGSETRLSNLLPNPNEDVHQLIAFKEANASEALHTSWRNGIVSRQIDQLLSGAAIEIPPNQEDAHGEHHSESQQTGQYLGGNGIDLAGSSVPYHSPPQSAPSDSNAAHLEGARDLDSLLSPVAGPSNQPLGSESLRLPTKAWSMLEDYFTFTQTWLPITERHDVLKLMYSYPASGLPRGEAVSSDHAELWGIMAWSAARMEGEARGEMVRCRDIARSLIPKESNVTLGHIKSLLVLGLIDLASGNLLPAWLTIGSAIRLMTHLTSSDNAEATLFGDRLKHTYLAAFVLESTIAMQTGALAHLKAEDITSLGPLVEDGLDEWSPWQDPVNGSSLAAAEKSPARSISTFNELLRMAQRRLQPVASSPQSPHQRHELSVVFELLRNGSSNNSRLQPSTLLARQRSLSINIEQANPPSAGGPVTSHTRTHSSPMDLWNMQPPETQGMALEHHYPYMSIPNETTESLAGSTPAQMTVSTATPSLWPGESSQPRRTELNQPTQGGAANPNTSGGNIFEELAMLDRTDSTQNPNFMENLGFGPDLDLAEFFGADYQPSDPLLAYMQPNEFADFSQPFDDTGPKDAG